MRRVLLVLLLLMPLGAAQADETTLVMAPVQTVVDEVPAIVGAAVQEARLDGTPDRAEQRAGQLIGFVAGIDASHDFPGASAAARNELETGLRYSAELARFVAGMPSDIGQLQRSLAACQAWQVNATASEAQRWIRSGRQAEARLGGMSTALQDFADRAPAGVDPAPLQEAVDDLATMRLADGARAEDCYVELGQRLGLDTDEPFLSLRLLPASTWPSGQVVAVGGVRGAEAVQLQAPALLLDETVTVDDRGFYLRFEVPLPAPLGIHDITASAGGLVVNESLRVHRAPAVAILEGPERIDVGRDVVVSLRIRTPLPDHVGDGPVAWSGDVEASSLLVDGRVQERFAGADAGLWRIHAAYPGSALVQGANATLLVTVVHPAADASVAPGDPSTPFLPGAPDAAIWPWFALAVIAVAIVAVAWQRLRIRRPQRAPAVPGDIDPELPDRGFVAAVASLMAWLRNVGRIRPGTTVREAGRDDPELARLVPGFEKVRYGKARESPEGAKRAPGFVQRILARMRGTP